MLSCRSRPSSSTRPYYCATANVERLASELADAAGAPVELERPNDPSHGDYATNVALRLAPVRKRAPRTSRPSLPPRCRRARASSVRRSPGPASSTCGSGRRGTDALAEIIHAGRDYGSGSAAARARPGRDGLGEPDRPDHGRVGAQRCVRRLVARLLAFAGDEVAREYYYNDAGAQMEVPSVADAAREWGGSCPRTATTAPTSRRSRSWRIPWARC